jgi:hypothetical protein
MAERPSPGVTLVMTIASHSPADRDEGTAVGKMKVCPACKGSRKCALCGGRGKDDHLIRRTCQVCNGKKFCQSCNGHGMVK